MDPRPRAIHLGDALFVATEYSDARGIRARHFKTVIHRFEMDFEEMGDVYLFKFERRRDVEGAFGRPMPPRKWSSQGAKSWPGSAAPDLP